MKKFFLLLVILLVPAFILKFLNKNEDHSYHSPEVIVVSSSPYQYFVERFVKDKIPVEVLVPSGASPHLYEPTPQQVKNMAHAQIWFTVGESFEKKIKKSVSSHHSSIQIVDLLEGLPLIEGACTCKHDHLHDHNHTHNYDVHVWMSPKLALKQCQKIHRILCDTYPEMTSLFNEEMAQLTMDLTLLDEQIQAVLKPHQNKTLLVSHPAFGYFCREYGLRQLSVETEGKDPLPHDLDHLLTHSKKEKVQVALLQKQYNNKATLLIADKMHVQSKWVDPYSSDYLSNLLNLAFLIANEASQPSN